MELKLLKKKESFVSKEDGKLHNCYGIYLNIGGVDVKIAPIFKNHKALLSAFAELVDND